MFKQLLKKTPEETNSCVNKDNSTLAKKCIAMGKCRFRFTAMCDTCKNNIGAGIEKNYYKKRDG